MYLFFDTETTGTPKNYKAPATDLNNWPRVIQLAWVFYDTEEKQIASSCLLIRPNGWVIPKEKFWIDNGFSTEKSLAEGVRIETALDGFINAVNSANLLIAHNLQFDLPIMQAEMIRAGMAAHNKPKRFCTMRASTNICKLPGQYGFKWPKLEELHKYLFGESFDGAHDALEDVMATARCFFEMKRRELIQLGTKN